MKRAFLILPATVVALAGCQTGQDRVRNDPKAAYERCVKGFAVENITAKHEIAAFVGVSVERMPSVVCRRLVDAAKTGRLSLSDINRLQLDQPTDVYRILKGK
jgi:hypothetical protein